MKLGAHMSSSIQIDNREKGTLILSKGLTQVLDDIDRRRRICRKF